MEGRNISRMISRAPQPLLLSRSVSPPARASRSQSSFQAVEFYIIPIIGISNYCALLCSGPSQPTLPHLTPHRDARLSLGPVALLPVTG